MDIRQDMSNKEINYKTSAMPKVSTANVMIVSHSSLPMEAQQVKEKQGTRSVIWGRKDQRSEGHIGTTHFNLKSEAEFTYISTITSM